MTLQIESSRFVSCHAPAAKEHIDTFIDLAQNHVPFTFVRFSDGEIEILRNRRLIIENGLTTYKGAVFRNSFPEWDTKTYLPERDQDLRRDLMMSATYRASNFFKGIPTAHNRAVEDREFMLRLNGGCTPYMTYADLLLNENYNLSRNQLFPVLFRSFETIGVVANFRSKMVGDLNNAIHIPISDNFFVSYSETLSTTLRQALALPSGTLLLCSASSLTNILGYRIAQERPDMTVVDVGTAINDLLCLPVSTRAYHRLASGLSFKNLVLGAIYRLRREYRLKW